MNNEHLGELQQKTGKILLIKRRDGNFHIEFATSTGDIFKGIVPPDFEGVTGLATGDVAYMEYFEYPQRNLVTFEIINKMERAAIQGTPKARTLDEKKFFIRHQKAIQKDLGYTALFVDSDKIGLPLKAFFLMDDGSLLVINYKRHEDSDKPENYASARAYLMENKHLLERADPTEAIYQLAQELNSTN